MNASISAIDKTYIHTFYNILNYNIISSGTFISKFNSPIEKRPRYDTYRQHLKSLWCTHFELDYTSNDKCNTVIQISSQISIVTKKCPCNSMAVLQQQFIHINCQHYYFTTRWVSSANKTMQIPETAFLTNSFPSSSNRKTLGYSSKLTLFSST